MDNNYSPEDRTKFGAGRIVQVIVNNPNRERHGKTGRVYQVDRSHFTTSGYAAWVFWDDDHYPSYEDLISLAPASES